LPGGDWAREAEASGVIMIPVPKSGVLERVDGVQAAREVPGITDVEITARVHDFIAAWPEGSSYLGFLFARRDGAEAVEKSLREAHAALKFTMTDQLTVEHPATGKMIGRN
jgi:hypothetical protein